MHWCIILTTETNPSTQYLSGESKSNQGGGGGCKPLITVFSRSLSNVKVSDLGHISNLFYILCDHFDGGRNGGTTLPGGKSEGEEGVRCNLFQILEIWSRHFEKYLHTIKLILTEHVGMIIFLLYKKKKKKKKNNFDIQKNCKFSGLPCFMASQLRKALVDWTHLVSMDRGDQYLSIDTKTKFIGVRLRKSREGVATTSLVKRVTKIAWLDEG